MKGRIFIVKVCNNSPKKRVLFERSFASPCLDGFDFHHMVKCLDFLFSDIPHIISFELTDENIIFD